MKDAIETLTWAQCQWLLRQGVPPRAIIGKDHLSLARGGRAQDGIFEPAEDGNF